jgi:hypothetical protein
MHSEFIAWNTGSNPTDNVMEFNHTYTNHYCGSCPQAYLITGPGILLTTVKHVDHVQTITVIDNVGPVLAVRLMSLFNVPAILYLLIIGLPLQPDNCIHHCHPHQLMQQLRSLSPSIIASTWNQPILH